MPRRRRRQDPFRDYDPDEELDFDATPAKQWLDEDWSDDEDADDSFELRARGTADDAFDPEELL